MSSATIAQQVRSFLMENFLMGQEYTLGDSDSLLESGIIDSTGVLQLVAYLQEAFGITVEEGELRPENLDSVTNLSAYVRRKRGDATAEAREPAPPAPDPGGNP